MKILSTTMKVVAVWFRNDLRVHDNGSLNKAASLVKDKVASHVLPVYTYDPRYFGQDARSRLTGIPKTGLHRQHFIAESLRDLRKSLRKIGSDLLISEGRPEDVFAKLLPRGSTIITQKEVTQDEQDADLLVNNAGFDLQTVWGLTMYDLNDILSRRGPQQGADFSSCMTMTNKLTKSGIQVRPLLPTPKDGDLPFPETVAHNDEALELYGKARAQQPFIYSVDADERLVYDDDYTYEVDRRGVMGNWRNAERPGIRGGETVGLTRAGYYIVKKPKLLDNYKNTRNGMLHADYSSKFSAWLAHGCISPRLVYHLIKQHEKKDGGPNPGTQHMLLEMRFRDFFIFYTRQHNPKIFFLNGVRPRKDAKWLPSDRAMPLFRKWIRGETG